MSPPRENPRLRALWRNRPRPPAERQMADRHSLHRILTRICTLPPRLADYLLRTFSRPGDVVFDPFCGKGTIPLQACLTGRHGIGADVSPEAVCSTLAAVRAPSLQSAESLIAEYSTAVARRVRTDDLAAELANQPESVRQLYHPDTLQEILAWRQILQRPRSDAAAFLRGLLLGILHGKGNDFLSLRCSHSYSMSPAYVRRYAAEHGLRPPLRNVSQSLVHRARSVLRDGPPPARGTARLADARDRCMPDASVDLILTSPPYFSVHRYARDNWLRLWFLGFIDYRVVQRALVQTANVARYRHHMSLALARMRAALRPRGRLLLLVGDVTLRRRDPRKCHVVRTAELLATDARSLGFKCEGVFSDTIPQAFKVAGYLAPHGGIATERLVILRR